MVKLYKDIDCTIELINYGEQFSDVALSVFTKTPVSDSVKIYAKKEGSETHEHFALRFYQSSDPRFLEASVGLQKSFPTIFTKIGDKVYSCEDATKLAVNDFITFDGSKVAQITTISGNQITLDDNLGNTSGAIPVSRLLPLGDTTNPVEITISRNVTYEEAVSLAETYYYYNLNTFWAE